MRTQRLMRAAKVLVLVLVALVGLGLGSEALAREPVRYVRNEVLVRFRQGVGLQTTQEVHRGIGAWVRRTFRGDAQLQQVRLPAGWAVEQALAYYLTRADVLYAQPNYVYHINDTTPNDAYFSLQWPLDNYGQSSGTSGADVHATQAWDKARGRFTVVVGSIDTGIDYLHPDLALNIWTNPGEAGTKCSNGLDDDGNGYVDDCRGWNYVSNTNDPLDDNYHGTHTAGIIGALTNNALGVAGANWDVQLMPVKVFDAAGNAFTSDIVLGLDYATRNGARVTNNSYGGGPFDQALKDAIGRANAAGVLFIASAGNGPIDNDVTPFYPCSYDNLNIVCVAATDHNDDLAGFSNFGDVTVDLGAPGEYVVSTVRNGGYSFLNGTSQATPFVTGAAALLKGCRGTLAGAVIKQILLQTARPLASLAGKTATGGMVNYQAAINDTRAAGVNPCDAAPSNVLPVANPGGGYATNTKKFLQFNGSGSYDADGQVLLYLWDFGDGSLGVGPKPLHQYNVGGLYTARLTVRDNKGGIDSETVTVTIRPTGKK